MQCPTCKVLVPDGAIFCAECGSPLPRPCPGCGHPSPPGAKFCPECAASIVAKVEHSQALASTPPTTPAARERRQLTILFCDMVGSSALSTRLDPEEQGEVIAAFHSCCAREIKALDGMVAQYLGDGVLAYFGYPAAHEDDAERAVRAGLSILDAVSSARPAQRVAVQARIGVATGVVMVGDLVGEGITQENAAIGETTNLAARLQSLAAPNSIVISPVTHRLVGALFDYRDLGRRTLKGFPEPVHVRQVLGPSKVERAEARAAGRRREIVAKVEHSQAVATPPTTPAAQERRQLTILFCDMVGSSALSTRLDPEEQGEVIAAFHSCCAREIKALDGMVAQYLGDGVLAYFGYPAAHEDDAERAVRAGLSILDAVSSARPAQRVAVQARIGVATGVVMVGDLVGEGITQENAAIGETTNLAARLQSLAAPNSIVISPVTHRLVGALFDYRDLGRHTLKGFPEPVHVRQVLGPSKVESRFEAHHQAGTSPLLGREDGA